MESQKPGAHRGGLLKQKVAKEEFDIEGQMNGGEGNDAIIEIEEEINEGQLQLTKADKSLSKNLIAKFLTFISEAHSASDLVEVAAKCFQFTLKLANSVQLPSMVKTVNQLSKGLTSRAREITANIENASEEYQRVMTTLIEALVNSFAPIEGASQGSTYKLTPLAAKTLFSLTESFLSQQSFKVIYSTDIARLLVSLTSFINDDQEIFVKKTSEAFNIIKSLEGYNQADFVENVLNTAGLIRFTYLALLNDPHILISLEKSFAELVMNDKMKSNWKNFLYFATFLSKLDSASFFHKVYPEIEFMMNRNGSLVSVIGDTVSALTFPFSPEFTLQLSANIFQEEYLVKDESILAARAYFGQLGAKLTTPEAVKALVNDFLMKKFVETRNSSLSGSQRLALIRHISQVFKNVKKTLIDQELVKHVISAAIEFFYIQKDDAQLKDAYADILSLFSYVDSADFLKAVLQKSIGKASNIWHVNLITDLMLKDTKDLSESVQIAAAQFKILLNGENFKTITTFAQILALVGFFTQSAVYLKDQTQFSWLYTHESVVSYLATRNGFVNTLTYWQKGPTYYDVRNHLLAIEHLLITHYAGVSEQVLPKGDAQLRDTLCEYLLSDGYNFREHQILDAIDRVSAKSQAFIGNFMKSLYTKIKQISTRPPTYNREESEHKRVSLNLVRRVQLALKYSLRRQTTELTQEEFIALVKMICHPYISKTNQDLKLLISELELLYNNGRLQAYFEKHAQTLIDFAIRERSGILSHDKTLRALAINIGVVLSSQKLFTMFIDDIAKILNYKPLEMMSKLEKIFIEEFDRISFYDLMFYSEISKDLLNVFSARDAATIRKELDQSQEEGLIDASPSHPEEEKEEAVPVAAGKAIDPSKLAAQLLKQKADAKKGAAAAKKPVAAPAKPAPKPQAAVKKAPAKVEEEQPMNKAERNKADRQQLLDCMLEMQRIKGDQIEAALEIVKRANINDLYLDLTLNHLLMPLIKLLNYSASRFSTNIFLQTLFECHRREPLFQVKNEIVSCLNAISHQRIYIKHMRDFQTIFQHIENNTQVSLFDKGYIQMIMVMANCVLKDLSVHLSVKEQALAVVQTILESTNLVANIDLVIVTINMMKSSYNNDNLAQYISLLFRRLNLEEFALILQRIFEYEPVPRRILLEELLKYEGPLYCPVWFSTQLWVLQFDEECAKYARKLWNRYGLVLRSGAIDLARETETQNIFHYLRSKNTNIFDNSIRGMVAAIDIFQTRYDLIIDDLIEFYNKEITIIQNENAMAVQDGNTSQIGILSDERLNRIAVAEVIKRTAHLVQASSFKKILDFFITQGCLDQIEQVSKGCMDAALELIKVKGADYSEELLKILERYLNDKTKSYSELSKNQAIIMIGSLSNYLDNTSQKKLAGTFEKMLELLNTPSELIRQSVCKVIPQLARFFDDKSKKFLEDHLKVLLKDSQDEKAIRGSAYAVAGIVKGLGMQTFISLDILNQIKKDCFSKQSDQMRKISGLYLYETFTFSLGKVFEMQVERILPDIMQTISDPKENVRRAALQANRAIMSRLSNHAIKQVLPIFLKGLYQDNWRAKLASVEALGNTAFCAPRQIAGFLPQIVKGIREVLSDTHEKVHEAALQAIKNIGSVIKCPEIADILETLVKALSNPNVFLKDAMKVLLDTSFVHAIDAPSLSLLIPILDSGLMMHDNESKHLAAKLMGNICNLTQDPADLMPYIKILMPAIKNSLFDSIPEIRASASRALGSLSKGLGLDNSAEMVEWLHSVLMSKQLHSSERSGAAQGFAEIISVHGIKYFEDTIKLIIAKSQENEIHIRESYRNVMVFLATSFEHFVKYLPKLLPIMIQGLSDDCEEVRKISLRNVKICIKLYGKQAPNQLVNPIMEMMFHKDFRVRQSSSVLMYQLVKELENDIIKLQPKYITNDVKNEILSSMFILKYDIVERVATQASQIWKNIIENQLKVLKSIVNVLIKQLYDLIQSEEMELQEMGLNCLRGIVEKFGDKFVSEIIDILESYMERATDLNQTIAVTKSIYNMTSSAPIKLLTDLRVRFLTVIDANISHENAQIRSLTAKTVNVILQKTFEPNFMTATIDKYFLKKLHTYLTSGMVKESELLILTLQEILKDQPTELKLEDKIIRLCNSPAPAPGVIVDVQASKLSIAQCKMLATIAGKIAANMNKKKNCAAILSKLIGELAQDDIDDEKRVNEVLITFSEVISQAPEQDIWFINENVISDFYAQCKNKQRLGFYVDFIAYYCSHSKVNYEKFAKMYLENVLVLMNEPDEKLVEKVVKSFTAIVNGLQKENQFTLIPLIKECIENIAVEKCENVGGERTLYKKKVDTIKMLEKAEGVKNLSSIIQNSITHSSQVEIRIDSAICFQYLIDFSKSDAIKVEVIKICGALIRVVNDKFPPALKIQIFQALKLILIRVPLFAKAMAPQLQTTFLKAFNDSQATPTVRKTVVECLIQFLKIAPKVDPIVKELASMVEGDKVDEVAKAEVAEALALIIRLNGKVIQTAMSTQIQTSLTNVLKAKQPSPFLDKTQVNCAVALAFLSAYASDNSQMLALYEAYDSTLNLNISFGLKFGVLLNGAVPAEKKAALLANLEEHLADFLKDMTGIEEIDQRLSEDAEDEQDKPGRLHGSFEILGYIGDVYVRRFASPLDEVYPLQFKAINQAGVLAKLNERKSLSDQTFYQVLFYLQSIPVRYTEGSLHPELARVIAAGFEFINSFYLEFEYKKDAQPAVLNLLQINYDNYLSHTSEESVVLTEQFVREVVNKDCYKSILPEGIRMLAVELAFI